MEFTRPEIAELLRAASGNGHELAGHRVAVDATVGALP